MKHTKTSNVIEEKPTAIIFIGIQASGKSSYYRQNFAERFVHINLDTLHTRNNERIALEDCLHHKKDFVIDNTNPTKADRARYITIAKEAGYQVIGYFFQSKTQDCIKRNALRTGKACIPAHAIAATSNKLELPDLNEGFDKLYFVAFGEKTDCTSDLIPMITSEWREENEL